MHWWIISSCKRWCHLSGVTWLWIWGVADAPRLSYSTILGRHSLSVHVTYLGMIVPTPFSALFSFLCFFFVHSCGYSGLSLFGWLILRWNLRVVEPIWLWSSLFVLHVLFMCFYWLCVVFFEYPFILVGFLFVSDAISLYIFSGFVLGFQLACLCYCFSAPLFL